MAGTAQDRLHPGSIETRQGWIIVAASLAYIMVAFGPSYLLVVSLKPIAAGFGWPRWVPSLAYSLLLLGTGLGGIVMGLWADRAGLGKPALLGALVVGSGVMAASFAANEWVLLLLCGPVIGFLGTSAAFAPLLTNTTRWFDRRRGIAVSVVASGQALAGAIWPQIFNYGIEHSGWRQTWFAYGALAICVMLPLVLVLRRPPPEQPKPAGLASDAPVRRSAAMRQMPLAFLSLAIVGCCVAMAMPMVHIVAYCTDLGFEAARGAEMLSLLLACSAVSRLGFGFLSDRLGGLQTIFIGAALQAIALSLFAVVDSLAGLYLVSALFGLVFGGIVPAYALATREMHPDGEVGWRMGVVFFFGTVGMALGGFLGGWIFDLTGYYPLAFVVGVSFNIVNLLSLTWLIRYRSIAILPKPVAA
ncbi:MFS transporter [Nisaea sediminum]|uniref:MFS transporter n=1 Tax=Nisaea sediminum TaxID=2775867 RepID=UPI00186739B5|nr:MFS transporter [Nisaea sediminum]